MMKKQYGFNDKEEKATPKSLAVQILSVDTISEDAALLTRDFSEIESHVDSIDIIKSLADHAGHAAASVAAAIGLPKIFVRNNEVIQLYADGRSEVISTGATVANGAYFVPAKKNGDACQKIRLSA